MFKNIPNLEKYSINQFGTIITRSKYHYDNKIFVVKPYIGRDGYKRLNYKVNGKNKHKMYHRLVWETFVGEIPSNFEINHIDGNKLNNRLDNLEVVTSRQNKIHAQTNGLHKARVGENNPNVYISDSLLIDMIMEVVNGSTMKSVNSKYNVGARFINQIFSGISRQYIWSSIELKDINRFDYFKSKKPSGKKLTDSDISKMKYRIDNGEKVKDVCNDYGVSKGYYSKTQRCND